MDSVPRILVVDDHDDTRAMLTRLLEPCGYEADGVEAALALAAAHWYDLVLCDVGLPDGDGCDLMRDLRARHGLAGIALTGYGMPNVLRRVEASGFLTHLLKPVEFDDLRAAIGQALARTRDRGEVTSGDPDANALDRVDDAAFAGLEDRVLLGDVFARRLEFD